MLKWTEKEPEDNFIRAGEKRNSREGMSMLWKREKGKVTSLSDSETRAGLAGWLLKSGKDTCILS